MITVHFEGWLAISLGCKSDSGRHIIAVPTDNSGALRVGLLQIARDVAAADRAFESGNLQELALSLDPKNTTIVA